MLNNAAPVLPDNLTNDERDFFQTSPLLADVETRLQQWVAGGKKYELGVIFDGQILKLVTRGKAALDLDNATAPVTVADLDLVNTNRAAIVLTHNHPSSSPLSRGDVALAVTRGIKAVRAVGVHGAFAFERLGANWGPIDAQAVAAAYAAGIDQWKAAYPGCLASDLEWKKRKPDTDYRPREGTSPQVGPTFAEDFFMAKHYACRKLAADHPGVVAYTHPAENALVDDRRRLYELRIRFGADARIGTGVVL